MSVRTPLLLLLVALYAVPAMAAREIGGVLIGDHARVAADGERLTLNGAGVYRRYFFFKVYVAALYLPHTIHDAGEVLRSNGPKRLALHFGTRCRAR